MKDSEVKKVIESLAEENKKLTNRAIQIETELKEEKDFAQSTCKKIGFQQRDLENVLIDKKTLQIQLQQLEEKVQDQENLISALSSENSNFKQKNDDLMKKVKIIPNEKIKELNAECNSLKTQLYSTRQLVDGQELTIKRLKNENKKKQIQSTLAQTHIEFKVKERVKDLQRELDQTRKALSENEDSLKLEISINKRGKQAEQRMRKENEALKLKNEI